MCGSKVKNAKTKAAKSKAATKAAAKSKTPQVRALPKGFAKTKAAAKAAVDKRTQAQRSKDVDSKKLSAAFAKQKSKMKPQIAKLFEALEAREGPRSQAVLKFKQEGLATGWTWDSSYFQETVDHVDVSNKITRENWVPVGRLKKLLGKQDAALAIKHGWYAMRRGSKTGMVEVNYLEEISEAIERDAHGSSLVHSKNLEEDAEVQAVLDAVLAGKQISAPNRRNKPFAIGDRVSDDVSAAPAAKAKTKPGPKPILKRPGSSASGAIVEKPQEPSKKPSTEDHVLLLQQQRESTNSAMTQAFMRCQELKKNCIAEQARYEAVDSESLTSRTKRDFQNNKLDLEQAIVKCDKLTKQVQPAMVKTRLEDMNKNIDLLYELEAEFTELHETVSATKKMKFTK